MGDLDTNCGVYGLFKGHGHEQLYEEGTPRRPAMSIMYEACDEITLVDKVFFCMPSMILVLIEGTYK